MKHRMNLLSGIILIIAFSFICGNNLEGQLPATRSYRVDLKIDYKNKKLSGGCQLSVRNNSEHKIDTIPILIYRLLTVADVKNVKGEMIPFEQEIVGVRGWEQLQVNFIRIFPEPGMLPGEEFSFSIDYEGYLLGYANEGWRYVKDNISEDFTLIRPDGFGYPVIGYPDVQNMMAIVKERYDYQIAVTVPLRYKVASGGQLIRSLSDDTYGTYFFSSRKPSWRIDIAVADYGLIGRKGNMIYYFRNDSIAADKMLGSLENTVDLLTEWFGPAGDYKGYTIIEVPEGYSSQADVTSFNITADSFKKENGIFILYHEISHLWNVKPVEDQPCRIESEGLARFLEYLVPGELAGDKDLARGTAQKFLESIRKSFTKDPAYQEIAPSEYGARNMTEYSYTLGMVMFSVIYDLAGKENFNNFISTFYRTYQNKPASLNDFTSCAGKTFKFDTERFFNDWLYSTRTVKLIVSGKNYEDLKKEYYCKSDQ